MLVHGLDDISVEEPSGTEGASSSGKPFKCSMEGCKQSYARKEHLERHIRTHNPDNKYQCDQCDREFARTDVLKRHKKLHERDDDMTDNFGNARKQAALERITRACRTCSASKVKCSGEQPTCDRCTAGGRECVYPDEGALVAEPTRARSASATLSSVTTSDLGPLTSSNSTVHFTPDPTFTLHPNLEQVEPANNLAQFDGQHHNLLQFCDFVVDQPQPFASQHLSHPFPTPYLAPPTPQPALPPPPNPLDFSLLASLYPTSPGPPTLSNELQLDTTDLTFWSAFLSPEVTNDRPLSGVRAAAPPAGRPARSSRLLPSATGIATRHGSPTLEEAEGEAGEGRSWPPHWTPTETDSVLHADQPVEPLQAGELLPDSFAAFPKFDEASKMCVLETIRFAQLTDHEYHALYRTLSRTQLSTYDLLIGMYFHHFHPTMPILHMPSFRPNRTLGFLLLVVIAIGAIHAPVDSAPHLGRVLLEVARRGIQHLTDKDNRLARSLPVVQAFVIWSTIRCLGSPRMLELAQAHRSVYTTQLRKLGVFEDKPFALPEGKGVDEQWAYFIEREERKRVGVGCFLLEAEFATLCHLPPSILLSDLQTTLPAAEELWAAPTAQAWREAYATAPAPAGIEAVVRQVLTDSSFPLPASLLPSPLSARLLVQELHLLLRASHQLRLAGMAAVAAMAAAGVRRSLGRLGRGASPFEVGFGEGPEGRAAGVAYHFAQMATYLAPEELDVVAGAGTGLAQAAATRKLVTLMQTAPEDARALALHAGQLVRLVTLAPTRGTYEPSSLFYAAVVLFLFAKAREVGEGGISGAAHASEGPGFVLDGPVGESSGEAAGQDAVGFVVGGGRSAVAGVDLGERDGAAGELLGRLAEVLHGVGGAWRVGQNMAEGLRRMAAREHAQARQAPPPLPPRDAHSL